MPPALALLPALAAFGGAELLPALAGPTLLGLGTETLGGLAGGALAGGLLDKKNPALGALEGGVGGALGGPGLAEGFGSLTGLGVGAGDAASAGLSLGKAGATGATSALSPVGGAAATTAAPSGTAPGADLALKGSQPLDALGAPDAAFGSTPGTSLTGGVPPSSSASIGAGAGRALAGGASGGGTGASSVLDGGAGISPDAFGDAKSLGGGTSAFGTAIEDPTLANLLKAGSANSNLILPAVGMGLTALHGNQALPGEKALEATAKQEAAQGSQLQSYLQSGTLPPGIDAGLRSASEAAKASLRSMFAQRGMSGSSSEVEALASVDQTTQAQGAQIALNLLDRGLADSQMSTGIYRILMEKAMQDDAQLGAAFGNFGAALAGGTPRPAAAAAGTA